MPALYETWNPVTERSTTIELDTETGLPLITKVQNTRPVVESAKRLASNFDKHRRNPDGWTHVARVPAVVWQNWQRLGITKDPKALNAVLNLRECSHFRTDDGRRL